MQHNNERERQEVSIIGRILSLEGILLLMGIASLVYGIAQKQTMSIFWGLIIIPGVFLLHKVRKKDWKKHWEELEAQQQAYDEAKKRMQQKKDEQQ